LTFVLTNSELAAVSLICALALFMAIAFMAYSIFGQKLKDIADTGILTVVDQITFSIIVIYVVALLMLKGTVTAASGLPVLAGLAGGIVGKARGGGTTNGNGGGGGGGGTIRDEGSTPSREARRPASLDRSLVRYMLARTSTYGSPMIT
jgi:hypothetical protein